MRCSSDRPVLVLLDGFGGVVVAVDENWAQGGRDGASTGATTRGAGRGTIGEAGGGALFLQSGDGLGAAREGEVSVRALGKKRRDVGQT